MHPGMERGQAARFWSAALVVAALALVASAGHAAEPATAEKKASDEADAFFKGGQIPQLVIVLDDAACAALRAAPREWVQGEIRENRRTVYPGVMVKLKGAAGSFREFDDTPSLTVKVAKVDPEQRFHGLKKFYLNRSPQDPTYLREFLGSEIYRAAGLAAPRVTHAHVWINERDMGLYVLKEGFDELLLERSCDDADGVLYDGGFCQDIDAALERDEGPPEGNLEDLSKLLEACREPDLVKRWAAISERVDVPTFIRYMALELMLGHWDGYCENRNNYRLRFDSKTGKASFIPHGMDQILGDPAASILDNPTATLANAVMRCPAWRQEYRKCVGELLPLFDSKRLKRLVESLSDRLEPVLKEWSKDQARNQRGAVEGLKTVLDARERSLREQKTMPDPKPLVFRANRAVPITGWRPSSECEDAVLTAEKDNGVALLLVSTGKSGQCMAGWRRSVLLSRGRYRFHAVLRMKDVVALVDETAGNPGGAALRVVSGSRSEPLVGTQDWKPVDFEFEVAEEEADVELAIELRSTSGELQINAGSIWLGRIEKDE